MKFIRHAIVDTDTNKVVNVVEYETEQTGIPPGFEVDFPQYRCVKSDVANTGDDYVDGQFVDNRPKSTIDLNLPTA